MKPETLAVIIASVSLISAGLNAFLSVRLNNTMLRLRLSQLESEKRVLNKVDRFYVRKDSALLVTPRNATA